MAVGTFEVFNWSGKARAGRLETYHGFVETPIFMPVGTRATVKGLLQDELEAMGSQIILGNTYHLHLRPGEETIKKLGGLHKFMNWTGPILTDSGGFQVFSLSKLNEVTEDGVRFKSHLDGDMCFLTPEKSMQIQMDLGSDIIMAFDELVAHPSPHEKIVEAMDRTLRWLHRSKEAMTRKESLLFGIVQGGLDLDLRMKSLEQITGVDLPGYALGGYSVGEPIHLMHEQIKIVGPQMPKNKPRYLMGVGTPLDLILCVDAGIDMFDCVMPARVARNGTLFTWQGRFSLKRQEYKDDPRPLDPECSCIACTKFSRAYLRHLFVSGELLSARLNTIHNLHFYLDLMTKVRKAIREDRWAEFRDFCLTRFVKNAI